MCPFQSVFESVDLAPALAASVVVDAVDVGGRLPRPCPLLGLTKRSRHICLVATRVQGVVTIRAPCSDGCSVLEYVLERDEAVLGDVPYKWMVAIRTPGLPLLVASYVPLHALWARTQRTATMAACVADAPSVLANVLLYLPTRPYALWESLSNMDIAQCEYSFYQEMVAPLLPALRHAAHARDEYCRWSRQRGFRRLFRLQ